MAGAGRRVFQPGEVLTASNVMSYLQDQAVMVFDSSAARGSAIGTAAVSEGMTTYLKDSDALEFYNGTAWTRFAAGTGLPIANGGTGANTLAGAQAALDIAVLQVKQFTTTTYTTVSSTSFQNTTLTDSITPSSTSSKILISVTFNPESPSDVAMIPTIFRGTVSGTNLGAGDHGFGRQLGASSTVAGLVSIQYLDSPATTSSVQYMLAIRAGSAGTVYTSSIGGTLTMTLMEIAG